MARFIDDELIFNLEALMDEPPISKDLSEITYSHEGSVGGLKFFAA